MHRGMKSILCFALLQASVSYATTFHTIIGPDGRPMIVPINEQKKVAPVSKTVEQLIIQQPIDVANAKKNDVEEAQSNLLSKPVEKVIPQTERITLTTSKKTLKESTSKSVPLHVIEQPKISVDVEMPFEAKAPNINFENFGSDQYVSNEYLENKEFNLEGRKRFYTMPEGVIDNKGGSVRLQTIEREKGVGQSVLQALFKKNSIQDDGPITLASTYYRVSQNDAVEGLGQECFNDKKIKKSKVLAKEKDINLWPRAPLADEFDYEVVKLENEIQNVRINSYASRERNPTFYWPFVVFLNEKACVIEGAGGYKNQESQASVIQHINIEGVIHVPKDSHYILMTPLASAIDVDQHGLTNHGQLKLSVIR